MCLSRNKIWSNSRQKKKDFKYARFDSVSISVLVSGEIRILFRQEKKSVQTIADNLIPYSWESFFFLFSRTLRRRHFNDRELIYYSNIHARKEEVKVFNVETKSTVSWAAAAWAVIGAAALPVPWCLARAWWSACPSRPPTSPGPARGSRTRRRRRRRIGEGREIAVPAIVRIVEKI